MPSGIVSSTVEKKRKKLPKEARERLEKQKKGEEIADQDLDGVVGGAHLDWISINVRLPPKRRDLDP